MVLVSAVMAVLVMTAVPLDSTLPFFVVWICEPFSPLQPSKTPETPNLSKICPSNCFGVPVRGTEIWKNLSEFEKR